MDKKSLIGSIIVIGLFISVIIWRNKNQNDLKKNGIIVQAEILGVIAGGKSSGGFEFLINYNNKKIELSSVSSLQRGTIFFIGKTFPAKYLPINNTLEILITPEDFEKFNIPFPDSLHWAFEYINRR